MELSFNTAWGPISQVAIPLIDVSSAVQLAVGAYGWWKARERTAGLVETINANGGHLAPCIAFNPTLYFAVRRNNKFHGTAWYDGKLESVNLPNASTGTHGDAGILCLRAITTVLLALYDTDCVTTILKYIIPQFLVNYNLDGEHIARDGPFESCVREYVTSIGAEEECNTLRNDMHKKVDQEHYQMFSTARGNSSSQVTFNVDLPTTLGILNWVLSPPSKREMNYYATRSLTAWSLSVMLSYVGFEVNPSSVLIDSEDVFHREVSPPRHRLPWEVFLVTFQQTSTDYLSPPVPESGSPTTISLAPRRLPINAIPMVIFRDIYDENQGRLIDVKRLSNVWSESFENAYSAIGYIRLDTTSASTGFKDEMEKDEPPTVAHVRGLQPIVKSSNPPLAPFGDCGGLYSIVASQLARHLPTYSWTHVLFQKVSSEAMVAHTLNWERLGTEPSRTDSPFLNSWDFGTNLEEWFVFIAILLSTAYATCCKSLCSDLNSASQAGLIEVAVPPTLLTSRHHQYWVHWISCIERLLGRDATDPLIVTRWHTTVLSMCTGTPLETFKRLEDKNSDICLGLYNNGVFLAMDIILNPSIRRESTIQFHIQFGQPLHIPVDEEGFVVADNSITYTTPYNEINLTDLPVINSLQSRLSDTPFRIDLEPCWERHPRRVLFRARVKGSVICSFSPQYLLLPLLGHRQGILRMKVADECICGDIPNGFPTPMEELWMVLEMSKFVQSHFNEFDRFRPANGIKGWDSNSVSLCIHAGGDVDAQIMCMVASYTWSSNNVDTIFATKCLQCALRLHRLETDINRSFPSNFALNHNVSLHHQRLIDDLPAGRNEIMQKRYNVILILQNAGFTPCIWSDDALSYYGAPMVGFELYILLPDADLDRACSLLAETPGYHQDSPRDSEMGKYSPRRYFLQYWPRRYMRPDSERTGVQLLPAEEFAKFHISPETTTKRGELLFPSLADYVESLVYQYLRSAETTEEFMFRLHVQTHLWYLIEHAPEPHSVLPLLSSKACRLWRDMLNREFAIGVEGIEYYRNFDEGLSDSH